MNANNDWDPQQYDRDFSFVADGGRDLLDLLEPLAGAVVLDLGCGTGSLTALLAQRGAHALGVDLSDSMVLAARAAHPGIDFVVGDGQELTLADLGRTAPCDAVLSNAALHWMPDGAAVARSVRRVLRPAGLFAAELGGVGNVAAVDGALRAALTDLGLTSVEVPHQNFPSVATQARWLEDAGFRIRSMAWFERPTPLPDGLSAADWTRHFRARVWAAVPAGVHARLAQRIDAHAAPACQGPAGWRIDYCRLRFVAEAG